MSRSSKTLSSLRLFEHSVVLVYGDFKECCDSKKNQMQYFDNKETNVDEQKYF